MSRAGELVREYEYDRDTMLEMQELLKQIENKYYTEKRGYMNTAFAVMSGWRYESSNEFTTSGNSGNNRVETPLFHALRDKLRTILNYDGDISNLNHMIRAYTKHGVDGFERLENDSHFKRDLHQSEARALRNNMKHVLSYLNSEYLFDDKRKTQLNIVNVIVGYDRRTGHSERTIFDETPEVLNAMIERYGLRKIVTDVHEVKLMFKSEADKKAFIARYQRPEYQKVA